jgi:hypothetical protein
MLFTHIFVTPTSFKIIISKLNDKLILFEINNCLQVILLIILNPFTLYSFKTQVIRKISFFELLLMKFSVSHEI